MTEEIQTKTCKMCGMAIPIVGKKCPYCHHWQHWFSLSLQHPLGVLLFAVIPVVVLYAVMVMFISTLIREGEPFSKHSDQVTIVESKMEFGDDQCGPAVVVIGKVKNVSPVDWKDVHFQVDFFDRKGQFFDTGQQEAYSWRVLSGQETAFKVSFHRQFPKDRYANYKVRVISGVDARQRF
jgi:hypothetical protein